MSNVIRMGNKEHIDAVIKIVCEQFDVSYDLIKSKTRVPRIVFARVALAYSLMMYARISNKQISQIVKRDHSTMTYYMKKAYESIYISDADFRKNMNEIRTKVFENGI